MSNFTPLVTKEYEFDGDKVTVIFTRLKRKDMLSALPAFKKLNDMDEDDDGAEKQEVINDVLNGIADVIPDYVKTISGLVDADGDDVPIETVAEEMYFMRLCAQIAMDIMRESTVPGGNA
jgi:hypothetical protein